MTPENQDSAFARRNAKRRMGHVPSPYDLAFQRLRPTKPPSRLKRAWIGCSLFAGPSLCLGYLVWCAAEVLWHGVRGHSFGWTCGIVVPGIATLSAAIVVGGVVMIALLCAIFHHYFEVLTTPPPWRREEEL